MPLYEYRCDACQKEFAVVQTMAEHQKRDVVCPVCNSRQVVQKFSPFFAKTSKKS